MMLDTEAFLVVMHLLIHMIFQASCCIVAIFSYFLSDLGKIWNRSFPQNPLSDCEFYENGCTGSCTSLGGINDYLSILSTYCPVWVKFGMRLHIMLFRNCGFCEDGCGESCTFLVGVIKLYLHIYYRTVWNFESKDCHGVVFVLCYGVHNLQS
jgi:hypothetical protein